MRFTVRILLLLTLIALALPLAGCEDPEPVKRIDLTKREEITFRPRQVEVTYAYLPQYSHSLSYQRHNLLVEYLSEATGLTMRQVFPDTFDEHMNMVDQGQIDISFSNPFIYVKMAHRGGAQAFARIVEDSGKNFRGQIIVRQGNESIGTLADVRGKRWLAVDPSSAGGFLFPLGHFIEHGIQRKDFAEVAFAPGPGGKQEKVVLGVASGQYDVGSIREGTLALMADKVDLSQIRVLAETRWYPGWVYSARKGLNQEIVRKIKSAMLALSQDNPRHLPILENAGFTAIIPSQDSDFDPVRLLAASIGLDVGK
ncbi:phosphate/phosphite/phosphonate ABC transporter substrate-binding protein [Desulfovibrio ferrophilus]|uniref:Phosphonate ABC transporter substrate-binding protein n=1 Tax=Desulfovibrio ferrophilus TaxID=241368 RepID=A0A2Z6B2W1_9BACT|nr:phosphate/phosphite/phosphonate ABC transporter substrate-binding protein [Desulfovibrio ferrophilus]BBD09832.1 phosphonate ABC transporter substrate-binding protein [Desulfovibrio ferrophilus]